MNASQLNDWNSLFCLCFALFLNSLLIWLVFKRSPKEFRPYSRILLQTCILDMLLAIMTQVTQVIIFLYNGSIIVFMNSPFARNIASSKCRFFIFTIWLLLFYVAILGLCVQFVYRYLILVKNTKISWFRYFLMLSIPFCLQIFITISLYFIVDFHLDGDSIEDVQLVELLIGQGNGPILVTIRQNLHDYRLYILNAFSMLEHFCCYGLIIFCGFHMVRHVRKNTKLMLNVVQQRISYLDRQLTRSLIILASMPLLLICVNIVWMSFIFAASGDSKSPQVQFAGMLTSIPIHWLPVLNPLVNICMIGPYRRAIMNLGRKATSSVNPIGGGGNQTTNEANLMGSSVLMRARIPSLAAEQQQQNSGNPTNPL